MTRVHELGWGWISLVRVEAGLEAQILELGLGLGGKPLVSRVRLTSHNRRWSCKLPMNPVGSIWSIERALRTCLKVAKLYTSLAEYMPEICFEWDNYEILVLHYLPPLIGRRCYSCWFLLRDSHPRVCSQSSNRCQRFLARSQCARTGFPW